MKFRLESKAFPSIRELLNHHTTTPVTRTSGVLLVKPISKFDKWSVRHDDILRRRKIGRGVCSNVDVFEGVLLTTQDEVAIKTCQVYMIQMQDMDTFLREAEILKKFNDPNIVRLIGVCTEKEPIYIITELMSGGTLLDFIRKKGIHQSKEELCQMCTDACSGMAYLEANNCIHCDLGARNCLVGYMKNVKISNFGMSQIEEGGVYMSSRAMQVTIKWTAPEVCCM